MKYLESKISLEKLPKAWPKSRKAYCIKSNVNNEPSKSHGSGNKAKRRLGKRVVETPKPFGGLPCPSSSTFSHLFSYSNGITLLEK